MKLFLVFALCGVTCCLAGPTCSRDELAKCSDRTPPGQILTDEEELDSFCNSHTTIIRFPFSGLYMPRRTRCFVEIYERCGTQVFAVGPFPVKGYRRVVDAFCDRSSPLREKYLETEKCFERVAKEDDLQKMVKMCGIVDRPKEEFCRKIPDEYRCAVDYIAGKCGKDAVEVAQVAFLPYLDPYDCLSS